MLEQLYIENIAVIEKSTLELTPGFNLLTGETGAGKSIIIDSINAVLGERTSRELIRTGCDKAKVTAVFTLSPETEQKLAALGFEAEDHSLIISRVIGSDGKNSCKIGDAPVTVSSLREAGRLLVNIHGQHDSQALLNPDTHYEFLDAVADNADIRAAYTAAFEKYRKIIKELRSLNEGADEKRHRAEILKFQIDELESAEISPGETEQLKERRDRIKSSAKIIESITAIVALLDGDGENDGAVSMVEAAASKGVGVSAVLPETDDLSGRLAELGFELENISSEFKKYTDEVEFFPATLEEIEDRLDELYRLKQKYGNTEEQMLEFLDNAKTQYDSISFSDKRTAELEEMLEPAETELIDAAAALTANRVETAEKFSAAVGAELEFLNMPGVKFIVSVTRNKYVKTGADRVEFLISANSGEEARPLSKVASGGELSRIMLAVKSVLAGKDRIPTLIFDEIDAGISGRAARSVGIKLKQVSKGRQVICITHLAQIAAMADNHMLIEKQVKDGRTFTAVRPISGNDRVDEIARIMSGGQLTESLEQTARELLDFGKTV